MYSICPSLAPVFFHLIKYADDTVFIKLLSKNDVLQTDIAAHDLAGWCHDNDLFLNVSKTKELLLCNLRDNLVHNSLIIDGNNVEPVDSFKYRRDCYQKETKISRVFHGDHKESPENTLNNEETVCHACF